MIGWNAEFALFHVEQQWTFIQEWYRVVLKLLFWVFGVSRYFRTLLRDIVLCGRFNIKDWRVQVDSILVSHFTLVNISMGLRLKCGYKLIIKVAILLYPCGLFFKLELILFWFFIGYGHPFMSVWIFTKWIAFISITKENICIFFGNGVEL